MDKKPVNLYLDVKLIEKFDKAISPYHRSNVITELISDYLNNKKGERKRKLSPKGHTTFHHERSVIH